MRSNLYEISSFHYYFCCNGKMCQMCMLSSLHWWVLALKKTLCTIKRKRLFGNASLVFNFIKHRQMHIDKTCQYILRTQWLLCKEHISIIYLNISSRWGALPVSWLYHFNLQIGVLLTRIISTIQRSSSREETIGSWPSVHAQSFSPLAFPGP